MERIIDHQFDLIRTTYGKEVSSNFGWAMDMRDDSITISTKIYDGRGTILTTTEEGGKFVDSWDRR